MAKRTARTKRKKGDLLPITLTHRECTARGWEPEYVERTLPGTFIRKDAYGLADVIALVPGREGTLYIQASSWSGHASHRTKALKEPRLRTLLETGNRFIIWSWVRTRGSERMKSEEFFLSLPDWAYEEIGTLGRRGDYDTLEKNECVLLTESTNLG